MGGELGKVNSGGSSMNKDDGQAGIDDGDFNLVALQEDLVSNVSRGQ